MSRYYISLFTLGLSVCVLTPMLRDKFPGTLDVLVAIVLSLALAGIMYLVTGIGAKNKTVEEK